MVVACERSRLNHRRIVVVVVVVVVVAAAAAASGRYLQDNLLTALPINVLTMTQLVTLHTTGNLFVDAVDIDDSNLAVATFIGNISCPSTCVCIGHTLDCADRALHSVDLSVFTSRFQHM